ncbi:MAG: deoxyribodipyrimidine photo-lyase [Alphaproteobacteria bacterium]|nr:deoxyribodipyrimidine photo-lyase [Alphaproteobacteria bacterium]
MDDARLAELNDKDPKKDGNYVLYWMQHSQRAAFNPALEYAIREGERLNKGVVVGFGLTTDYPDANARHFAFMLQGLEEVEASLQVRGIKFVMRAGSPNKVALDLASDAAMVVCDRGYLRHQRAWRRRVADEAPCQVVQVEGDAVVPVETASDKAEYAARTIRPKIERQLDAFLTDLQEQDPRKSSLRLGVKGDLDPSDARKLLKRLDVDRSVSPVSRFEGGTTAARERLTTFLRSGLDGYDDGRGEPAARQVSELSPYLHFGQISPVEVAFKARSARSAGKDDTGSFLEELIVRRELATNFVYFTEDYDSYACLPDWARKTLAEHKDDERQHHYTRKELEAGETHDPYWNAAMAEMRETGYMHNTMRMYWGKQIIKWCNTPEYAYETTLHLNNKYFLDGRDPNSFANVAWLFGLHDRAWQERDVLGKIRTMTAKGLERKYDMRAYVDRIDEETGGKV